MISTTATSYDPYKNVVDVMEQAVEIGHINKSMFEIIKNPQRETKSLLTYRNGRRTYRSI